MQITVLVDGKPHKDTQIKQKSYHDENDTLHIESVVDIQLPIQTLKGR